MITGRSLTLFRDTLPEPSANDESTNGDNAESKESKIRYHDTLNNEETETFYFIHRILKRTQLSCTTLILALIYIDRIKARLTNTLKKRTRLDQGPEPEHSLDTFQSSVKSHRRSHSNNSCSNDLAYSPATSTTSSTTSPSRSSSSPHKTSFPTCSTRHGVGNKGGTETWSSISLFLAAVICADKYLFDATFTNSEWADFTRGMYTNLEINELERRFLSQLQYKMYVSEPEFDGFLSYIEVVLQLQQVWGRGFNVGLSYSDVRILTQQLMPAYAGRLHFRTLQQGVVMVLWQVTLSISRIYLAIIGTVMVAAASYAALLELTMLSTRMTLDTMATYGFCPTTMMLHPADHAAANSAHTWNGMFTAAHYQHYYQAQFGPGAFYGSNADSVPTATNVFQNSIAVDEAHILPNSGSENMAASVMDWLGHRTGTLTLCEGAA
ncbi:hypothetical protein BGW41_008261 [Actinomortierella wolfii]|nr:hypothetical protein BGW41_008261 [Actinomortierella wolfii]